MKYDFNNAIDRTGCSAIKIDGTAVKDSLGLNFYEDSIPMWIADMDFPVAPAITNALIDRVSRATFGYTDFSDEYFDTIIKWYNRRLGMQFTKEEIVHSNGTLTALRNIIRAFTSENNGVIIQPPVYYPFKSIISECGRTVIENKLFVDDQNNYFIDFEDFELKCSDPNTKLFIFCNPHNPIGQIWNKNDAARLLEICNKHNVLFFSDEVHADIVRKEHTFISSLNLNNHKGLIVATAANKTFNLAGLEITNLVIPDACIREKYNKYIGENSITPIAMTASIAAYSLCEDWVNEMNSVIDENVAYLKEFLSVNLPKVRFNAPAGTYLAWLDFRAYNLSEEELLKTLSDKAHVIVEGGTMFGKDSIGFTRMNLACPKQTLVDALNKIHTIFKGPSKNSPSL